MGESFGEVFVMRLRDWVGFNRIISGCHRVGGGGALEASLRLTLGCRSKTLSTACLTDCKGRLGGF